jgi:glycosyltransferase involved in cell wall biosynthesis
MIHDYLEYLDQAGLKYTVSPLFDDRYFALRITDRPPSAREILRNCNYYFAQSMRRILNLLKAGNYHLVVFDKELIPYLPYGLEAILAWFQPNCVALYDEATYLYYRHHPNPFARVLTRGKIEHILQIVKHVIVWNESLSQDVSRFNPHVSTVNPAIDLRRYRLAEKRNSPLDGRRVVIGWMGTPNSFRYLKTLELVFKKLSQKYPIELHVVSSLKYCSPYIQVVNKHWSLETEVDDLCQFDIGITPLHLDEWGRHKSAVKSVQYLGVGIPVVSTPGGINSIIVCDGYNGFLAATLDEWERALTSLIENPRLRYRLGQAGRKVVEARYNQQKVAERLITIFQQVVESK